MDNRELNIENQDLNETVVIDGNNIPSGQLKLQIDGYPISESEFERLTSSGAGSKEWARRLLLISIGGLILLLAKVIAFFISYNNATDKNEVNLEFQNYEVISLCISLILCLLLFGIGEIRKNKKDKLISKIRNHFNSIGNE